MSQFPHPLPPADSTESSDHLARIAAVRALVAAGRRGATGCSLHDSLIDPTAAPPVPLTSLPEFAAGVRAYRRLAKDPRLAPTPGGAARRPG